MHLVDDKIPSVETTISLNRGQIKLFVVHPEPPSPTEKERSTERDVELIRLARKVQTEKQPVIVSGDLNDVAWSHTTRLFQRISGLLDPRIGRGFYNTFHAKYPLFRWPLDHFFLSQHFFVQQLKRLSGIGSDHLPIYISLSLRKKEAPDANLEPEAETAFDRLEAMEKNQRL